MHLSRLGVPVLAALAVLLVSPAAGGAAAPRA